MVIGITSFVSLVNATGLPATAQPVPLSDSQVPASLQLVGPMNGEKLLLPTARKVEEALGVPA